MFVTEKDTVLLIDIHSLLDKTASIAKGKVLKHLKEQIELEEAKCMLRASGIQLDETRLKKYIKNPNPMQKDLAVRLLINYRNVLRFYTSTQKTELNLATIQQTHSILAENILEYWERGRIRNPYEEPQGKYQAIRFHNNFSTNTASTLSELLNYKPEHPLTGTFYYTANLSFLCPFIDMNLHTALALAKFIVISSKYSSLYQLIPICSLILNILETYGKKATFTNFVQLTLNQAELLYDSAKTLIKADQTLDYQLTNRQKKLLSLFRRKRRISRADCVQELNVSFMTAFRDLKKLEKLGLIRRMGKGRSTFYVLNTD